MTIQLERYPQNPIIIPSQNWWENANVYNPGATIFNNQIILLYRAQGEDNISRFGLAKSSDGYNFERQPEPIFESDVNDPYARIGIEDPRITKIDDTYYIVYCSASLYPANKAGKMPGMPGAPYRIRVSLVKTKDFQKFDSFGIVLPRFDSKDATIFPKKIRGRYAMLHRVYPNMWIAYSNDLKYWTDDKIIMKIQGENWEAEKIGAGAQPIETKKGWLLFYHGVDKDLVYKLGMVFLDLKNPEKIIYRHPKYIFEPEESYEKTGLVANVVFTCGGIEKDDKYFVYYGAGDKVIGLATIEKEKILNLF